MPQQSQPGLTRYASAGVEFVTTFGLLVALGWWLDKRLGDSPLFTLIGAVVGFAAAMYRLARQAKAIVKEMQERNRTGDKERE